MLGLRAGVLVIGEGVVSVSKSAKKKRGRSCNGKGRRKAQGSAGGHDRLEESLSADVESGLALAHSHSHSHSHDHGGHGHAHGGEIDPRVSGKRQVVGILVLQMGIMIHSMVIGLTLAITTGSEFGKLLNWLRTGLN